MSQAPLTIFSQKAFSMFNLWRAIAQSTVMFCHLLLTFKILRCKAPLPLASIAVWIKIYFQEHKENIFHILAFLTSLDFRFPDTCQSIVNEVLAKKPKRRVEWVPFTTRSSCFWPRIWCSLHISLHVWLMFSMLPRDCFKFHTFSYQQMLSQGGLWKRCRKFLYRLTASCSNPATSSNHRGSKDEAMGAWHILQKSGQQMTTGFGAFHSQNGMMRWSSELQWTLPTHHYINLVVGNGMCGTCRPCADRVGAQSKSEQCFYLRLSVSMKKMGVHELQSMMPEGSREQV